MGVKKELLLLFTACFTLSAVFALSTSHPATAAPPPLIFPKDDEQITSALNIQSTSTVINTRVGELPPYHFPKLNSQKKYPISINKTDAKLPPLIFPKTTFNTKALDEKKEKQKLNSTILDGKKKLGPKIAMEVTDLLKGGENATIYEDTTETPMENDVLTVEGPHVRDPGTTHEEEEAAHDNNSSNVKNDTHLEITASPSLASGENVTYTTEAAIFNTTEALQEISNKAVTTEVSDNATSAPNVFSSTTVEEASNLTTSTEANATLNETEVVNENNGSKEKTADDNRTQKQTEEPKVETSSSTPKTFEESSTPLNVESSSEESSEEHHEKPMAMASQQHSEHSHPAAGKSSPFLQPTESAAILAGVFVAIALLGYVGLLIWRRILEKRYGNREMLVNEEDFYDTNDLKNFEL